MELSNRDSWEIKTDAHTVVGFDHDNNEWDPSYQYMDSTSLMASGMGKRYTFGHSTNARVTTFHPETVCRVAKKFLELTGEPLGVYIEGYKNWGDMINGPLEYHYRVSFFDSKSNVMTKALMEAIKDA